MCRINSKSEGNSFSEGEQVSYPINLDIEGKVCVVLGGGKVALRKINGLLNAGGRVMVIAPEICPELKKFVEENQIDWRRQNYEAGCIPSGLIFIAATNDKEVNKLAAVEASNKNMLVNVVNKNSLDINQFAVPSVIRRDGIMLTISTNGTSPSITKSIREYLEARFEEIFSDFIKRLGEKY